MNYLFSCASIFHKKKKLVPGFNKKESGNFILHNVLREIISKLSSTITSVSKVLIPSRDSQRHAGQRREARPAGRIERDIAPMLVDVDQEQAQRVDHDDRLEVQQALQEDEPLDVVGVRRLEPELETSYSVIASVEAVFPLPQHPQRDLRRPRAAQSRRSAPIVRHFRRYQALDRREELVGHAGDRDDVARLALLVQGSRDVKVNTVVVSIVHHEQFGREDVVVGRAQLVARPDHRQNDLRRGACDLYLTRECYSR